MEYLVILEKTFHGSSAGTTRDVIEAESEQAAIEKAISEWKKVLPKFWSVHPFYSQPHEGK